MLSFQRKELLLDGLGGVHPMVTRSQEQKEMFPEKVVQPEGVASACA